MRLLYRVLKVAPAQYYAWRNRWSQFLRRPRLWFGMRRWTQPLKYYLKLEFQLIGQDNQLHINRQLAAQLDLRLVVFLEVYYLMHRW